jgi:flagellar protein FliL
MAEEEGKEQGPAEPANAAKGGSKKKLLLILGLIVLLLLGGGGAFFMLTKKGGEIPEADSEVASEGVVTEGHDDEEELGEGEEPLGPIFPLDTFVVNLNGGGFIRMQVQIEFTERDIPKSFYSRMVQIRDEAITHLSTRTKEDLLTVKGKETLKTTFKELINKITKKEAVKQVYFSQFVVQ